MSDEPPILTVSQLTQAIKMQLENTFPNVWLQGEISNFRRQASGHLYFSLKDAGAQVSAVMFRGNTGALKALPKDGDEVIVKGEISVYPPRGNYQLIVRELKLAGLGELLLKLEELKKKIHAKGWFSAEHKKELPRYPKTIGVITSPTGAAIQDILNILTRRFPGIHVILNPVRVQGDEAAGEIAQAIEQFNQYPIADLLIVGRGGGSIEDLWAFNEEVVAEAIFNSKIPIIGAVGHETDHCIAEYVADVRAPTPSAAAEIATTHYVEATQKIDQLSRHLQQTVGHILRASRQRLASIKRQPVIASPLNLLSPWIQKLDDLRADSDDAISTLLNTKRMQLEACRRQALALNPKSAISHNKQKLATVSSNLSVAIGHILNQKRERLKNIMTNLEAINPKNLLQKGYTIAFSEKDRSVITSAEQLSIDESIRLSFADGDAIAKVKEKVKK